MSPYKQEGVEYSELISKTLAILYPFILIIGAYLTLNGHRSPGGGFQGGAVFAAIYITKYLILPIHDTSSEVLQKVEKIMLLLIVLFPILFLYTGLNAIFPMANTTYMIGMNALISIKVACGLTIIFFRFVYYEAR
jgi:multicomponent Na+:H+ antiporter subunit B